MKPKIYTILSQAVESGIRHGWHKVHKHIENPSPETIIERIDESVMASILEYFTFDSEFDD